MPAKFYEINDKPAYEIDQVLGVPFVLQFNDEREKDWVPCYDAEFSRQAVPISEERFRQLAGDMAHRLRTRL